jgi:hypothetical protein
MSGFTLARAHTVRADEAAWIAAVPCALVTLVAIVLLGPPIGHAFFAPGGERLWPPEVIATSPETDKFGRYVVALLAPLLLATAIWLSSRRRLAARPRAIAAAVATSQAILSAFVVVTLLVQEDILLHPIQEPWPPFARRTLVVAVGLAALLTAGLGSARIRRLVGRGTAFVAASRPRQAACVAIAALGTVAWLLPAVNSDATIGAAQLNDLPPWAMGDTFAILNGRTPLVDFHPIYSVLWGYAAAVPMRLLGPGIATFTVTMTAIAALTLLLVYDVFRRVTGGVLPALALYLPFLALGFIAIGTPGANRWSNAAIFSVWPMRYGGPYVLAWLTARHVGGAAPRRAWLLLTAAGLVLINNIEFGLGAFAATLVALAAARRPTSARAWTRLAGEAAAGLLAAAALVSLLGLVRAGALPHFGLLLEYPRIFGVLGIVALPLPTLGLHLAIYVTFVAAIATAVVRLARGARGSVLTCMLLWSGSFGLVAGGYYLGRPDSLKLAALFSAWGFSLMLLTVAAARSIVARAPRRPQIADATALLGFALAVCMLGQFPPPWSQVDRLRVRTPTPLYRQADVVAFIGKRTAPGEKVVIVVPFGHRIADRLDIGNVSPFIMNQGIVTRRQWEALLDAMEREGASKLFLSPEPAPALRRLLARARLSQHAASSRVLEWLRS